MQNRDLDAYVEPDVKFHHSILSASKNDLLLRIWDSLSFDIRLRSVISKVSGNLTEVVESHQSIVNELENGRGKEAGLLLRNHSETFLHFLKKAKRDSGIYSQFVRPLREIFSSDADLSEQAPLWAFGCSVGKLTTTSSNAFVQR
jgi:hypothetical protein